MDVRTHKNHLPRGMLLQNDNSFNYGTDHEVEKAAVDKLSAMSIKQARAQQRVN